MNSKFRDLLFINALAVLMGLMVSGIVLLFLGENPFYVYATMVQSITSDRYIMAEIFVKTAPLILTSLAFGFAFQANLFNIGAQGQFYVGALIAVSSSLFLQDKLPGVIALVVVFLLTLLGGGLWGAFIGYAKAKYQASEFLVSMMSTYVALAFMNYFLRTFLLETKGEYPQTDPLNPSVWLGILVPNTRLHVGFILSILIAVGIYVLLFKTALGYRIRVVGHNADAAKMAGINEKKIMVITFVISGALAALAGFIEVNGVQHMLVQRFSPGVGAAGIGIAILANAHPIGIIFASILFGALQVGGVMLGQTMGIPSSFVEIMQGSVMIFVIASYFVREQLEKRREKRKLKKVVAA